jgi:hypothetical protein
MYAVVIFPYTKSIRVILIKKNIEKNKSKVCYYNKNLEKTKFLQNPIQKGFAERRIRGKLQHFQSPQHRHMNIKLKLW